MLILVINCGSSSAKYQLFDIDTRRYTSLAKGIVERIGSPGSSIKHQRGAEVAAEKKVSCKDHYAAIKSISDILTDRRLGAIGSRDEIDGIGHRVVHGGEEFERSVLITKEAVGSIRRYSGLAPLHNPPSLVGIKACSDILKGIPQVAVFDTAFHQTMPAKAFLYGLPLKYYRRYGIRRYGFHGTSHRYVAEAAAKRLNRPLAGLKLITCHLGNGCSMTAVERGRSVDTSMGFTPLEGLVMGTRSGDLDPAIVLHLLEKGKFSLNRVNDILNKESGLLGISGVSNDMRDIIKKSKISASGKTLRRIRRSTKREGGKNQKSKMAKLAIDMFIYRIEKYIGAYMTAMRGLDAVVFTAGIGENHPWLVKRIAKDLKSVVPKNAKFLVIPTNEELLIARDTYEIIKRRGGRGA